MIGKILRRTPRFPWFSLFVLVVYASFSITQPKGSQFLLKIGETFGAYSTDAMEAGSRALQIFTYVVALPFIEAFFGLPLAVIVLLVGFLNANSPPECTFKDEKPRCCGSWLFWPIITAALLCSGYVFKNALVGPVAASIFAVAVGLGSAAFDSSDFYSDDTFVFFWHTTMAMAGGIAASAFLLSLGEKSAVFPLLISTVFYLLGLSAPGLTCPNL